MIKRTLSTVGLWTVVLGTIYLFGAPGGVVLLAVFTLLAQYEFQGLLEKSGLPPWKTPTLTLGFIIMMVFGMMVVFGLSSYWQFVLLPLILMLVPVALVVGALASAQGTTAINRLAGSVLALVYVPFMMIHYLLIFIIIGPQFGGNNGLSLAIWVIAVAKFTDVGGYLIGSIFGRHKLAPSISPGKTWEGVAGGLLLSALVAYLPVQFAPQFFPEWLTPIRAVCLAFPIGIAAIVSDLSEIRLQAPRGRQRFWTVHPRHRRRVGLGG